MIDRGSSWPARSDQTIAGRVIRLPLNIAEWRLLLMGVDALAINGALLLALVIRALRVHEAPGAAVFPPHLGWFVILSGLYLAVAHAFDAYEPQVA